jgi:YD repeat-containing protein
VGVSSTTRLFSYDADGLLNQAGGLTLTRDPQNGNLTGMTLGNESEIFAYSDYGELASSSAGYGTTTLLAEAYTRDQLGRVTQNVETIAGVTTTFNYSYDAAGRLIQIQQDGATTAIYTYDSNSNRMSLNRNGVITNGAYDDQDHLTQYGGTTYSYTANGELETKTISGQTTSYNYDELGNLPSVIRPDGTSIEYVIDGQNRRIGKKVGGTLVQGFSIKISSKLRPNSTGRTTRRGDVYYSRLQRIREEAGITIWPQDALRHSFTSYRYAACSDENLTRKEMGHYGSVHTFLRHYKNRVRDEEAKEFWAITPNKIADSSAAAKTM